MSRRVIGPFNRVEGDLEVQLEIAGDRVQDAWVVSPLYRGFEQILCGKAPLDALVYTPRICGICSVSQSVAAARALADVQGLKPTANGLLATNIILAAENLADHLTHFYLFFMPDFAREIYRNETWYEDIKRRFQAVHGSAVREVLPARAQWLHIEGILAGKWPHSLALQPGGTTRPVERQERARLSSIVFAFRRFLEQVLFGSPLDEVLSLETLGDLERWMAARSADHGDFARFLNLASSLSLQAFGATNVRFMSYGVYPDEEGTCMFRPGVWYEDALSALDLDAITEDVSHGWMEDDGQPRHPFEGITVPRADQEGGYTWCKAPRLGGAVVEVGALARQVVNGHPLLLDLVRRDGANVRNRVIARVLEIALVVDRMDDWIQRLQPGEPFCVTGSFPEEGRGVGLTEAARGSLGHWLEVRDGKISNYQIIAPTTWNFSPRDHAGQRGPLEEALIGAVVRRGEKEPVSAQHIVRSFDPCMVCTVH